MRNWLLIVAILLSGCVPAKQFVVESPDRLAGEGSEYQGEATLYVFRENAFAGGGWSIEVLVDGVRRTTLRTGTYAFFPVQPGTREIKFHWLALGIGGYPDIKIVADLAADKTYYFTFSADAHVVVNTLPTATEPSKFSSSVRQIDQQEAQGRKMTFEMRDVQ